MFRSLRRVAKRHNSVIGRKQNCGSRGIHKSVIISRARSRNRPGFLRAFAMRSQGCDRQNRRLDSFVAFCIAREPCTRDRVTERKRKMTQKVSLSLIFSPPRAQDRLVYSAASHPVAQRVHRPLFSAGPSKTDRFLVARNEYRELSRCRRPRFIARQHVPTSRSVHPADKIGLLSIYVRARARVLL